jgi:hypothetical protein
MRRRVTGWILQAVLWALRRRDEAEIANRLRAGDYHGYALAEIQYWHRWQR